MENNNAEQVELTEEELLAQLDEQHRIRIEKLNDLKANGKNPYEITKFEFTHKAQQIRDNFEELEGICDKVALISDGHIIDVCDMKTITDPTEKVFKIEFNNEKDYLDFLKEDYVVTRIQDIYNQATIKIGADDTAKLLKTLNKYSVKFISEIPYTLEKHFKEVLKAKRENTENVQ